MTGFSGKDDHHVSKEQEIQKNKKDNEEGQEQQVSQEQEREANKIACLKRIIARGRQKGMVSYQEIMDAFERVELSPDEIEEIYEILTKKGIEIVGGSDDDDTHDSLDTVESLKEDEESLTFPFRKGSLWTIRCGCI